MDNKTRKTLEGMREYLEKQIEYYLNESEFLNIIVQTKLQLIAINALLDEF